MKRLTTLHKETKKATTERCDKEELGCKWEQVELSRRLSKEIIFRLKSCAALCKPRRREADN